MAYVANPVNFDGTNDVLRRAGALTGIVDGKILFASFWFRDLGSAGGDRKLLTVNSSGGVRLFLGRATTNKLTVVARNSAGSPVATFVPTNTIPDTNWHHVLISFDLASASNRAVYFDGAIMAGSWTVYNDDVIDLLTTGPDVFVGAQTVTPGAAWNGDVADFYFHTPATWIDPSVSGNINKFIDTGGYPVDLGADGSTPLGVQPLVFLSGATAAWHTNKGSGGGFTLVGAITDGAVPLPLAADVTALPGAGNVALTGQAPTWSVVSRFAPDSVLASSNLRDTLSNSPPTRLADIDEAVDADDAEWFTAINTAAVTDVRVGLAAPPASALIGTQQIRVLIRATSLPARDVTIELWEAGANLTSEVTASVISSAGQIVTLSFQASEVTDLAAVEVRIVAEAA